MNQTIRDQQFEEVVHDLKIKFHEKNIINADSFLTIPRKNALDTFFDIQRKYQRLEAQLAQSNFDLTSVIDNIEDLAVYSILFKIWLTGGGRTL